jgi:homoserine trans-succinylase
MGNFNQARRHSGRKLRIYRGADNSLARPTSRFILFDGENISFDASLVIYINNTNIPPIMIINRIYDTQNLLSL